MQNPKWTVRKHQNQTQRHSKKESSVLPKRIQITKTKQNVLISKLLLSFCKQINPLSPLPPSFLHFHSSFNTHFMATSLGPVMIRNCSASDSKILPTLQHAYLPIQALSHVNTSPSQASSSCFQFHKLPIHSLSCPNTSSSPITLSFTFHILPHHRAL